MRGFDNRWTDFPDYILGITKEIWEDRGLGARMREYYAPEGDRAHARGVSQWASRRQRRQPWPRWSNSQTVNCWAKM